MSAKALYELQGDSEAALESYKSKDSSSMSAQYNELLLTYLAVESDNDSNALLKAMEEWKLKAVTQNESDLSATRKKRKEIVVAYNFGLVTCTAGRPEEAAGPIVELLHPVVVKRDVIQNELVEPYARLGLLVLECALAISEGNHEGLQEMDDELTTSRIVRWMESLDFETHPQLKFLLHLYKARLDFADRDESGKLIDTKVRSVKKELRSAMEVLSHKMRAGGETASIGSSSDVVYPEEHHSTPYVPGSSNRQEGIVQRHNQSALNLKAHFEQIKGNAKKSIILCTEAQHSYHDPSYDAIHNNNLAVTYETCGKRHLALHAASKAIAAKDQLFATNGMASSAPKWAILHNAAICALTANRYLSAYECMALCVRTSPEQFQKPRCWLRMAEACIGIHVQTQQNEKPDVPKRFRVVEGNGGAKERILIEPTTVSSPRAPSEEPSSPLGSDEDLEFVKQYPLWRALSCLTYAANSSEEGDKDCYYAAMCSLAYVKLELQDYQGVLDSTLPVMLEAQQQPADPSLHGRAHMQRLATMRMYASEACYALDRVDDAIQVLSEGSKDDPLRGLDRLSLDLSAASLDTKGTPQTNSRLAKARCVVQTNAGVLHSVAGNLDGGKQLCMSALQIAERAENDAGANGSLMDDMRSSKQALLYCMLREGNIDGALTVLRSM